MLFDNVGWSITRLKAYMTIDMVYCVNDRFSKLTPWDVTFTSIQEEYLHEFDVTLVLFDSNKSTWINTVLTILKIKIKLHLVSFYDIDIFEMTTYASLLTKKSSFIMLCPRKGLQLTGKSSSYRIHYTFLLHDDWNRNNGRSNVM